MGSKVFASGGGAVKYKACLPPHTVLLDELQVVIRGMRMQYGERFRNEFILANAGTGASIVHVQKCGKYARIGGTAVCGGMFAGLAKMLLLSNDPWDDVERALTSTSISDSKETHTLVRDIYGNRQDIYGLPSELIAGFLGKVGMGTERKLAIAAIQEAITFNLAHLTWCTGKAVTEDNPTVPLVFTGGYLKLPRTLEIIDDAMVLLQPSGGHFVHTEGFSGAVGCLQDCFEEEHSSEKANVNGAALDMAIRQDSGISEVVEN